MTPPDNNGEPGGPAAEFYAALKALGCTYCETCGAYMFPDHREHVLLTDERREEIA